MFSFDGLNKLITLDFGIAEFEVQDMYSAWKEWVHISDNAKWLGAFISIGGESIGGGQSISPYFQLINNWKIRTYEANHLLTVIGNLITEDDSNPFLPTLGNFNVSVRSVVTSNSLTTGAGANPLDCCDTIDEINTKVDNITTTVDAIETDLTDHRNETEERIKLILGLNQHNFKIFDTVYDANNLLIHSRVKIYNTSTDLDNDINHISEYEMDSVYDTDCQLQSYKMVQL